MKNLIKIFILLFIVFVKGQNDNLSDIEVKYHVKFVQDSLDKDSFITAEMVLLSNQHKSYYFNPEMVKVYDHLSKQARSASNVQDIANNYIPLPKIRHSAWRENGTTKITTPLGQYNYSYIADEINWELLPDTKKIDRFTCHLAKTNIDGDIFYVWYTTEVPFSEGPFKFKGLPGLIMELYNEKRTIEISAANVEMKQVEIRKMREALNVNLKNRTEFLSARQQYLLYPLNSNYPKERIDRKREELKKINVFLD